jgi:hypothetical protein
LDRNNENHRGPRLAPEHALEIGANRIGAVVVAGSAGRVEHLPVLGIGSLSWHWQHRQAKADDGTRQVSQ